MLLFLRMITVFQELLKTPDPFIFMHARSCMHGHGGHRINSHGLSCPLSFHFCLFFSSFLSCLPPSSALQFLLILFSSHLLSFLHHDLGTRPPLSLQKTYHGNGFKCAGTSQLPTPVLSAARPECGCSVRLVGVV